MDFNQQLSAALPANSFYVIGELHPLTGESYPTGLSVPRPWAPLAQGGIWLTIPYFI